ncbi:MAG: aminoglycoside N(3)-acetyltransferase, partial [Acidimicrobiia bacterium]
WIPIVRDQLPAFDVRLTPTRGMGQVVECFRALATTVRSNHPLLSVAANGPMADAIVASHPLTPALGETSPLRRLYDLDAIVALLGVGHRSNTSIHLAEYRAVRSGRATVTEGAPVLVDGQRRWVEYEDLELDESDFDRIGEAFARTDMERTGPIGNGIGRRCTVRDIVDFAGTWMIENRIGPAPIA